MNPHSSKAVLMQFEGSVMDALAKIIPKATLPVGGKLVTSKELRGRIQTHVDTMDALVQARAKVSQLVALDRQQRAELMSVMAGIQHYVAGLFGEHSMEFASFGFKPKKVPQRTVESKAQAAEKLRATRLARHTLGKRQKASIHGMPATPKADPAVPPALAASVPSSSTPPVNAGANGAVRTTSILNGAAH